MKMFWELSLHFALLLVIQIKRESFLFASLMIARLSCGIRSLRIKIAMITRWWSVGERSPVNSETIALVIGHGRPRWGRGTHLVRSFPRFFTPLSRPFFCLFPSSPSYIPFRVPTPSVRCPPPLTLKTYLKKIDQARTSIPTSSSSFSSSHLLQSSHRLAWSISRDETTPNYEIWVRELCIIDSVLFCWGSYNAKFA